MAGRLDRDGYVLELDERFESNRLDVGRWVSHYLPQWTTPERSAARFDVGGGLLRLRIDVDQPEWREADAGVRVSNVQSGTWSGPLGSARGQHRHEEGLTVVSPLPRQLYWRRRYRFGHGPYWSSECDDGGALDLHPGTDVWP